MSNNVQMPISFLTDVYKLVKALNYNELDPELQNIVESLKTQIDGKFERMARHSLYTQSKTGETEQEREMARKEYLNLVGINEDWQH